MKRIFVIFAIFAATSSVFAQDDSRTTNDAFFAFDNNKQPTEIHTLGSDPEFPFLRNLSTSQQVYAAIKKNERMGTNKHGMSRLNDLLVSAGFDNGVKDLQASDITAAQVPSGSVGNMGSGKMDDGYYKLTGDPSGYKAWKITSGTGNYVFIFSACGNAFYPNSKGGTACVNAPVNVTSDPKEITVGNKPSALFTDKTYVYYHMRKHRDNERYGRPGIADDNPSRPLLLRAAKRTEATPQTYRVTVASPVNNITVCPDSTATIAADINVEQISSYTGNYPGTANDVYKEVSRHEYRKAERKMRKVEKKEAKVSATTDVTVNIEE